MSKVTFNFTGHVTLIDDRNSVLDKSITLGSPLEGSYTIESTTSDNNSFPDVGDYWHYNPGYGVTAKVGPYTFATDPAQLQFLLEVVNRGVNDLNGPRDNYLIRSYKNLPINNQLLVDRIFWQLDDPSATALNSDSLPLTPPDLSKWDRYFGFNITGVTQSPSDPLNTISNQFHIRANIDSITLALPPQVPPEPIFFDLSNNRDRVDLRQYSDAVGKTVRGLDGNDLIEGTESADSINGNQGDDILNGHQGDDFLMGGKGSDRLDGFEGNDILTGNDGDDDINGQMGYDILRGGKGNDRLRGEEGNDILIGDFGKDILEGGPGSNLFVLRSDKNDVLGLSNPSSDPNNVDIIMDFYNTSFSFPNPNSKNDKIGLTNGLSFANLTFESVTLNDGRLGTAIRIGSGEYIGFVVGVAPNVLQNSSVFVNADGIV